MKSVKENVYWVWFSLIPNLGNIKKQKLLNFFKTPKDIYKATKAQLMQIDGIGEKLADEIQNKEIKEIVKNHIDYLDKNNINVITIEDNEYPIMLRQIYDYPISLYVKGNVSILNSSCMAVVGCRDATEYGMKAAKYFSYHLAENNICVVSGLAKGIDSYAHIGALWAYKDNKKRLIKQEYKDKEQEEQIKEKSKQKIIKNTEKIKEEQIEKKHVNYVKTIAVLGNGLDMIYPQENKELADMISKNGGAIISEYPLGTKPEKLHFPARNRIVSGMSKGVLVIEAKEKSGTLITVDFALEQGRDVFVVPRKY